MNCWVSGNETGGPLAMAEPTIRGITLKVMVPMVNNEIVVHEEANMDDLSTQMPMSSDLMEDMEVF